MSYTSVESILTYVDRVERLSNSYHYLPDFGFLCCFHKVFIHMKENECRTESRYFEETLRKRLRFNKH